MGPPQISEELPGQTKPQSESSFANKFVSVIVFVFASVYVFSSAFAGVVAYVFESKVVSAFECVSVLAFVLLSVSVFVSVSVFSSDPAVADLFLIADPVEVVVAVKTLTVVQKQSLI